MWQEVEVNISKDGKEASLKVIKELNPNDTVLLLDKANSSVEVTIVDGDTAQVDIRQPLGVSSGNLLSDGVTMHLGKALLPRVITQEVQKQSITAYQGRELHGIKRRIIWSPDNATG